ncbi:hypothetical protein CN689_28000 [Peribacillus butanolivorans]|uniref:Uncharacterized protein n=1 Tax=Peribacillus butanolivorans TaxID=421767 RepID=A0AAX0RUR2_9BACI|nr:hypothetical protein CN689_28000 [Peribacillus butanolivorans]
MKFMGFLISSYPYCVNKRSLLGLLRPKILDRNNKDISLYTSLNSPTSHVLPHDSAHVETVVLLTNVKICYRLIEMDLMVLNLKGGKPPKEGSVKR